MTEEQRLLHLDTSAGDHILDVVRVLQSKPDWAGLQRTGVIPQSTCLFLDSLHEKSAAEQKTILDSNRSDLKACLAILSSGNTTAGKYLLTLLFEVARNDSSVWDTIVEEMAAVNPFTSFMMSSHNDRFASDKCAYVLTAIMSHASEKAFSSAEIQTIVTGLVDGNFKCSDLGVLDGLVNLLKCDRYRELVWQSYGVAQLFLKVQVTAPPPHLYKVVFAIWLMSFDKHHASFLDAEIVAKLFKSVLISCRVEKIIRVTLAAIKSLMEQPSTAEQLVEMDTVSAVQSLEYEKWRDQDLYPEIQAVAQRISHEINHFSSFDRYERELASGKLKWGFIHSEKFWLENVLKFDKDDYHAIKVLVDLLAKSDPETLAVACHDLGEFSRLHPNGKNIAQRLRVKPPVMLLMASNEREVAREALLCVQKLMLDRWDEIAQK